MKDALQRMASMLPDEPRWIDARGALLSGACEVFAGSLVDFAIAPRDSAYVAVVGRPGADQLREAIGRRAAGPPEVLVQPDGRDNVAEILQDWRCEPVRIHRRRLDLPPSPPPPEQVRLVGPGGDPFGDQELPETLRRELASAVRRTEIAAWHEDGRPVSFSYAAVWTETLWDVAVETLEPFRGRGLAGSCYHAIARIQADRGRAPVWGAVASNAASLRLADKLGFEPIDEQGFFLFSPPEAADG